MANIENELNNIKNALYGKDVRSSIHNGIYAMNEEVEYLKNEVSKGIGTVTKKNLTSKSVTFSALDLNNINKFDVESSIDGFVVNTTGDIVEMQNHYCSDYIEANEYMTFTINTNLPTAGAWFDGNKRFIGRVNALEVVNDSIITVAPNGAKYLRVNGHSKNNLKGAFYVLEGACICESNPSLVIEDLIVGSNNISSNSVSTPHIDCINPLPHNLFNKGTHKRGVFVNMYGVEEVTSDNVWCSDFIEVREFVEYTMLETVNTAGMWYDKEKNPICVVAPNLSYPILLAPKNAKYIRFNADSTSDPNTCMFCEGREYYKSYVKYKTDFYSVLSGVFSNAEKEMVGKKWGVMGDSISANNSTSTFKWHDFATDYKMNKLNYAVSGSGFCVSTSGTDRLIDRIPNMASDLDVITIFAGTNDFGRDLAENKPFGVVGDTTQDTFCGMVDATFKALVSKYYKANILVILPIARVNMNSNNHINKKLIDYVDAIKEISHLNNLPTLDMFREGNMYVNNSNFIDAYMPDGLHPNNEGHKRISSKIKSFIINNM